MKIGVGLKGEAKESALTLWSSKVDNSVVILEHVDLIDVLKLGHAELLDG